MDYSNFKATNNKEIIKQCSQANFGLYEIFPRGTSKEVVEACDKFFKSRNIKYGSSWYHDKNKRKKEIQQAQNERNTDN